MTSPDPRQYEAFADEYEEHAAVAPYNALYDRPATLRLTAWRAPLTQLTEEFAEAGFVIERLVEPTPDPAMASSHPSTYEKLSTEPGFVLFRLVPAP